MRTMTDPSISVLYCTDREKELFKPYTVKCDSEESAVGWGIWDPLAPHERRDSKEESIKKLHMLRDNIFKETDSNRQFQLRLDGRKDEKAIILDSTPSVFLGIYLTLECVINQRTFFSDWTSITVTGDIKIDGDNIELKPVRDIPIKFDNYKEHIKTYYRSDRGKHLFLYVSNEKYSNVKSENNITIEHIQPGDNIRSVIKCVFEHSIDKLHTTLAKNMNPIRPRIKYIETKSYLDAKEKINGSNWNGFLIAGHGESGKSDMAQELAYYLLEEKMIDAPIWIRIETSELLKYKEDKEITLEGASENYIIELIKDKVKTSNIKYFFDDYKYLLIIDNLEFDNINDVLRGIKNLIMKIGQNPPYLIITSRTLGFVEMGLDKIESFNLSKEEIEMFVEKIINSDNLLKKIKLNKNYCDFINIILEYYGSYPGLIFPAIEPLNFGQTIEGLMPELKSIGNKNIEETSERAYRNLLSMLDENSMIVLFTILNNISPETRIGHEEIIKAVKDIALEITTPGTIERSLDNLVGKYLIYREAVSELPHYGIKEVPFLASMFGDMYTKGTLIKKAIKNRLIINSRSHRLHMALRYDRSVEIIKRLIKDIDDHLEIGFIYYQESMFNHPDIYITESIEYYKRALKIIKPENNNYIKGVKYYLQALNRATKVKESWGELDQFLKEENYNLSDPELQKERGDAYFSIAYYIERIEEYYVLANKSYENAMNLYSKKDNINAIREIKIKQAMNFGGWAEVGKSKKNTLDKAIEILTDVIYFNKIEINQINNPILYADKEMALGDIYLRMADVTKDKNYKMNSIAAYTNAINTYSKEKERIKCGIAWYESSVTYRFINPDSNDQYLSIKACKEALSIFHKNEYPVHYADTINSLGNAYKLFMQDKSDDYFNMTLLLFKEAEEIFQEDKKYHFMTGRIKHNTADLYLKHALNQSLNINYKKELLYIAIEKFKDAIDIRKKYPRYHVYSLLFLGKSYLELEETLPENKKEQCLREAIDIFEEGISIYNKHTIEAIDFLKGLQDNKSIAHERIYRLTINTENKEE